jgi:hypothetical protein
MNIPIFPLFSSGVLNFILGVVWNFNGQRVTGIYSKKIQNDMVIGIAEISASLVSLLLSFDLKH